MEKSKSGKEKPPKKSKTEEEESRDRTKTEDINNLEGDEFAEKEFESTGKKIRKVGDKLSEAADKGVDVIKEVFEKVRDFSTDAAELTKLKVEIRKLKYDRQKLFTKMGEKLWDLKKSDQFRGIQTAYGEDFQKLEELDAKISAKEEEAAKISL